MTQEWFVDPQATRHAMAGDPHRPRYHFLPPRNWMNDPNGLFYWRERYHLFYQFNPYRPVWGYIHWGHASSPDMIHWVDHPIALTPTEGTGDANGCWSGCIVDDGGIPTAIYTGFVNQSHTPVMLARAEDQDLLAWKKSPHNPILEGPPSNVTQSNFRDPYVWREQGAWKMVVGAGLENGAGAVLLYQSNDLMDWAYQGLLFSAHTLDSLQMWECPNFFPLGGKHALLVSLFPGVMGVYYYVGEYNGRTFFPEKEGFLTRDPYFYAPQARRLNGRMILFGWLLEGREEKALEEAGWAGVQSLPTELSLDAEGHLVCRPAREVESLRGALTHIPEIVLEAGESRKLPVSGRHLELALTLDSSGAGLQLDLLASAVGKERVSLRLMFAERMVALDLREMHTLTGEGKPCLQMELANDAPETLTLRVFIDGSVIEVWLNDRMSLTGRAYPSAENTGDLVISSLDGALRVRDLKIWKMTGIWPDSGGA